MKNQESIITSEQINTLSQYIDKTEWYWIPGKGLECGSYYCRCCCIKKTHRNEHHSDCLFIAAKKVVEELLNNSKERMEQ